MLFNFAENIMWLTVDNIQEKESTVISDIPQVPNMVGSGISVGAVVSDTVGASSVGDSPIQVSKHCACTLGYDWFLNLICNFKVCNFYSYKGSSLGANVSSFMLVTVI